MLIKVDLEAWVGSAVVRPGRADNQRLPPSSYREAAARLTSRQGVFYRNLTRLPEELGGRIIPVDFEQPGGRRVYLDRGCIKIAERTGSSHHPAAPQPKGDLPELAADYDIVLTAKERGIVDGPPVCVRAPICSVVISPGEGVHGGQLARPAPPLRRAHFVARRGARLDRTGDRGRARLDQYRPVLSAPLRK